MDYFLKYQKYRNRYISSSRELQFSKGGAQEGSENSIEWISNNNTYSGCYEFSDKNLFLTCCKDHAICPWAESIIGSGTDSVYNIDEYEFRSIDITETTSDLITTKRYQATMKKKEPSPTSEITITFSNEADRYNFIEQMKGLT